MSKEKMTQIGLHSVRNLLGEEAQLQLFSERELELEEKISSKLSGTISRFGVDLTDLQSKVMEGILRGFSETKYKGNISPKTKEPSIDCADPYKHIIELPCLKASQSQILDWAGINKKSIAAWSRAVEAIKELGSIQYCFYYDRLMYGADGQPLKNSNGRWKKEEVITVDTLFTIKEIRDETSGELKHYEISPSAIFLDQRESYFMLIPYNWREEVKRVAGSGRASSYTFRFIIFLMYQYAKFNRSNNRTIPYQIKWAPEEIATAIKMPESISKRKRGRMLSILDDAYIVAKQLGYLSDFERTEFIDILTFNSDKYCDKRELDVGKAMESLGEPTIIQEQAQALFVKFHDIRKIIDEFHKIPEGEERKIQLGSFIILLKERPSEDIHNLIEWALYNSFWSSQLMNPKMLHKQFPKAWAEFKTSRSASDASAFDTNKNMAEELKQLERRTDLNISVVVGNSYVEFSQAGQAAPAVISFEDKKFQSKVREQLIKHGVLKSIK